MANSEQVLYVDMNTDRMKSEIEDLGDALLTLRLSFEKLKVAITNAVEPLAALLIPVVNRAEGAAEWLQETFLKPLWEWSGDAIINALGRLGERLDNIGRWVPANPELTQTIALSDAAMGTANGVLGKFNGILGDMTSPLEVVSGGVLTLTGVMAPLVSKWDWVKDTALSVWQSIQSAWGTAGDWFGKNVREPFSKGFKSMVNGIIGFVNNLIAGVVSAANGIAGEINKLHFTAPDWVGGFGGKSVGFDFRTVNVPQIPYLAQGAVLPANKPFLAVVGDQRHGTNVEAPLATIQEAVAMVMNDQTSAILAGFATSVEVQREILQAVLGIQIGDDVIGNAMNRYQQKMKVLNGGLV